MDMEWSIDASSSGLSIEEFREAAKELFSESNASFEEIKNRPWYKSLLNAVTFNQGDKKLIVRNVRSLASLQSLFMEIYVTQLRNQDAKLEAIVQDLCSTQTVVEKLYCTCVLSLNPQKDIASLTEEDQQFLLLLLSEFDQTRCLAEPERERLQQYNSAVAQALPLKRPNGSLEPEQLEKVQDPAVFYRCVLEQCAVTGRLNPLDLPENVEEAIDYLDISTKRKKETQKAVQTELDDYGKNWFLQKYSKPAPALDERDFIFAEDEPEELPEADGTVGDDEKPNDPAKKLALMIDAFVPDDNSLGERLLEVKTLEEKNQLIAQLLPNVLPVSKTVLEITKLQNGYLVFTACAMYWVVKDQVCRVPYAEVNENCIGTKIVDGNIAFIFEPAGAPRVEVLDPGLNATKLEDLLIVLSSFESPESDTLTEFPDLPLELRLAYMKILVGIIWENGLPLHNVFRIAVRRGMESYWEEICVEPETAMEETIRDFTARIPYPNEEALAISLLQDLCIAYQYTKDSDVLTAKEKGYFYLVHSGQDSSIDSIVRYAQMEKQLIEGRIDTQKAKETSDAFNIAAGAVGASVLTYAGAWTLFASTLWFNFIPGIGSLLSAGIAGAAIASKYLSSKRDTSASDAQTRQKMKEEVMESYKKSERTAQDLGFDELSVRLRAEALTIAGRISYRYAEYTPAEEITFDEIREVIIALITLEKEKKFSAKLSEDLSLEEQKNLIKQMTFSAAKESPENIIGMCAANFNPSFGVLFMRDCLYFRKNKSAPIHQIYYHDILRVEMTLLPPGTVIHSRNDNSLTLNAANFDTVEITNSLQKIIKIVAEKM